MLLTRTFPHAKNPTNVFFWKYIVDPVDDRNDENIDKRYYSMTPTNASKQSEALSSKKQPFVSASKVDHDDNSRYNHHKVNSYRG